MAITTQITMWKCDLHTLMAWNNI